VISELRRHGAKEVHVFVTFPPIQHGCFYGIDFANSEQLLAAQHNSDIEQIRNFINADSLSYLSEEVIRRELSELGNLCMACVNGVYVDASPEQNRKKRLMPSQAELITI
jgi:amidophosphoribosyltransferase